MPSPRRLSTYPRQLLEFIARYEAGDDSVPSILTFPDLQTARAFQRELYGVRAAMEREGAHADHPKLFAARVYTRKTDNGAEVAVVSADSLPYAQALGNYYPPVNSKEAQ